MVDPIEDLAGVRAFKFTGADQLFKVPPKITAVWLSGIGGSGAAITRQFGQWVARGVANAPLEVSPGDHIRVRVGGRPDIVGRYETRPVPYEWKLSTVGGWNGGGNGGGTWGGPETGAIGELHACGGGGATTFHLVPAGQNPVAVEGELVAVMPGAPGTIRGSLGMAGLGYSDPGSGEAVVSPTFSDFDAGDYLLTEPAHWSFAGEPAPTADAAEFLGTFDDNATIPLPVTTPPTRTWLTLVDPFDLGGTTGVTFTTAPTVDLGNPGESFKGGPGRRYSGKAATAGGGGGYGGGASGARLEVTGTTTISGIPRDVRLDVAVEARHGGFLLPIERPDGWDDRDPIEADGTILTTTIEGVTAPLLYLPVATNADLVNPFGAYTDAEMETLGEDPDTMAGHGSARIQWARDPKRAKWRVGHVGWGRNNGW